MNKAWKSIKHLFGHDFKREWSGNICFRDPVGFSARENFVWVERCETCGEVRAFFKDILNCKCSIDFDQMICLSNGKMPYDVSTHKYLHS